jgi:hypothetical protein
MSRNYLNSRSSVSILFLLVMLITHDITAQSVEKNTEPQTRITSGTHTGGGIVFWTDPTGNHGLIAVTVDQSVKGITWNPGRPVKTGATGNDLYSGITNTSTIIRSQGNSLSYAASLCGDLVITDDGKEYDDWYLPSLFELNLLYAGRTIVGGFNQINGIYWSSTETTSEPEFRAWEIEFKYGTQLEDDKDLPNQVRCIRKF